MGVGHGRRVFPPVPGGRQNMMTELREYLTEAEAIVSEWYSRDGLEPSHERNIERLATLMVLNVSMSSEQPFEVLTEAARVYLVAAYQMGRASQ